MKRVREYNHGEIQVLIITKSGGEGLDLKNTRVVIIMEPMWNSAGFDQVVGRAVRYKSHSSLPVKDRRVDIYKMILMEKEGTMENSISGDVLLYQIIDRKRDIQEKVNEMMESISLKKK